MPTGFLQVQISEGEGALPLSGAQITITDNKGTVLNRISTDISGKGGPISLYAPDKALSFNPKTAANSYATYNMEIRAPGYVPKRIEGIQIFDGETMVSHVELSPSPTVFSSKLESDGTIEDIVVIEPPAILTRGANDEQLPSEALQSRILKDVIIPEYITVHMAHSKVEAPNVRVKFPDYIKKVASSEIYPTWPSEAIRANVLAQISLALNRIFTEWYTGQGYPFNITNSTSLDQAYDPNKPVSTKVSDIVDELFNSFLRREGRKEPFYAEYCNGSHTTCPGMSQWESYDLANKGKNAIEILRSFYPKDIEVVTTDKIESIQESYPGYTLKQGTQGSADVRMMQLFLNRISNDYPAIPKIYNPNGDFGSDTTAAVKEFQKIFNLTSDGQIGSKTWYKIAYIYTAVKKLAQLTSEGIREGIGSHPPNVLLKLGDKGENVVQLQYILDFLSLYYPSLSTVLQTSKFDSSTENAVKAFQNTFGLKADGSVGPATWNKLYEIYRQANHDVVPKPPTGVTPAYPGTVLKRNSKGSDVQIMQEYLNIISTLYPSIPHLSTDGVFGSGTEAAVLAYQKLFGLSQDGMIGPTTWNSIVRHKDEVLQSGGTFNPKPIGPPYPGSVLKVNSAGENVRILQQYLNEAAAEYDIIPPVVVDGIFGNGTKKSVMAYQTLFGLVADGIVGPATWNSIVRGVRSIPHQAPFSNNNYMNPGYPNNYNSNEATPYKTASPNVENNYMNPGYPNNYNSNEATPYKTASPNVENNYMNPGYPNNYNSNEATPYKTASPNVENNYMNPGYPNNYNSNEVTPYKTTSPNMENNYMNPGYPNNYNSNEATPYKTASPNMENNYMNPGYPNNYSSNETTPYKTASPNVENNYMNPGYPNNYSSNSGKTAPYNPNLNSKYQANTNDTEQNKPGSNATNNETYKNSKIQYVEHLLSFGSRGDDVKTLQKFLAYMSDIYPSIPRPISDGFYGAITQASIVAYQHLFGLKPTGTVGPETWASLLSQDIK